MGGLFYHGYTYLGMKGNDMTLRERYVRYLEAHEWKRDYTAPQSTKYLKYSHHAQAGWYFVGKMGAIRFSWTNASTRSISRDYPDKQRMIAWEKENGCGK